MLGKSRVILASVIGISACCLAVISSCVAWFASNYGKLNNDISGSVLESYFDKAKEYSGDPGSKTNPYVITNPKHYENLVKLYTQQFYNPVTKTYEYFCDKDYYFEIGKKLDDSGEYKVYEYDDYGAYTGNLTNTLNLSSTPAFEPIGNDAHPFNSHLEGHSITVSNFTVTAKANTGQSYNDIGIFGFVKTTAKTTNCYWSDFVIDATSAKAMKHTNTDATAHDDNVRIGYLAGHTVTYESFEHCYVNNCSIKSPSITYKQENDYGYYGMCEKDKAGSGLPGGKNYSYTFDTEIWHTYFNTNYSAIKGQPVTLRKHKEGEGQPGGEIEPSGVKLQNGILPGDVLSSYYVAGHTNTTLSSYSGLDYSLSTLGYLSGEKTVTPSTYPAIISTDGSSFHMPNTSATLSTSLMNDNFSEDENPGYHYAWNASEKQWEYYFSDNHYSKEGDTFSFSFTFDQGSEAHATPSVTSSTFDLYLDGDTWGNPSGGSVSGTWSTTYRKVTWNSPGTITKTLPVGKHVAALLWHRVFRGGFINYNYWTVLYGTKSDTNAVLKSLNVYHDDKSKQYVGDTIEIDLTDYINVSTYQFSSNTTPTLSGNTPWDKKYGIKIYGKNNKNELMYYQSASAIQLKNNDENTFDSATFAWDGSQLNVTFYEVKIDEKGKEKHYLADEKEIKASKYNPNCIDIVGGGVGFYYYNLGLLGQIKILRVQSEAGTDVSSTIVKKIGSSDLGKKFYAPTYTRQSLVLYVSNVGSAVDEIDDDLGSMDFIYYQLSTFNTCHPSFKKGAGSSVDYVDFTTLYGSPGQSGAKRTYAGASLKESNCKKACYCCLDSSGNILGTYEKDGSYGYGMTKEKEAKIATYVLAIGSFTNANYADWHLWINEIVFDYKSQAGQGGTFGSVGYRDAKDTITETILNFIAKVDAATQYMIKVEYIKYHVGQADQELYYDVEVVSTVALTITFYNYFPTTYHLYVNDTQYTESVNTVNIPATPTKVYPNFT